MSTCCSIKLSNHLRIKYDSCCLVIAIDRFAVQLNFSDFLTLSNNWVFIALESVPSSKTRNNVEIATQVWDGITTASLGKRSGPTNPDVEVSVQIKVLRYSRSRMINGLFVIEHKHQSKAVCYRFTTKSNTPSRCSVFHYRRLIV
jgi:hypothetical protein